MNTPLLSQYMSLSMYFIYTLLLSPIKLYMPISTNTVYGYERMSYCDSNTMVQLVSQISPLTGTILKSGPIILSDYFLQRKSVMVISGTFGQEILHPSNCTFLSISFFLFLNNCYR